MLFDENTMGGLRSVLDSAAQRTAGAIEGSRNVVERAKLRASLNDAYRKLGKAEYEAAVNGVSSMEEINMLIGKITELRRQMLDMERGMQRGGTLTCPTCGKLNSADDMYCPACGAQLR
ncbi:MAG: zinc ribbon domain-containing protein [Oscillospiraceae bacterium]|nr:zinc ribbon domain-containing protein [Oscillospiraceae bacterium]MBR5722554.1 zinc ribbon domain-containing protein [Oscillospiraceae bacterium]MCR4759690.1 zinc ribbon domain-containing protein [Oscillospiraceae bacterium]